MLTKDMEEQILHHTQYEGINIVITCDSRYQIHTYTWFDYRGLVHSVCTCPK